ncbi:AAA family ATPase [Marivita sp. GX14005]|uniref:ATP-dependent nuclease n=1 Tax=Marivita sp. GX14005 TaxID=2942276 RepID=UPI002019B838|nr:AAA family ATPase [Marivita sp. GX14005]MCL3881919.1 ATP-binding protein [Marivita sp. GX14005]
MIRSDIRTSDINQLLEKVREKKYGKYLASLNLDFVRGVRDQRVNFEFPVTAIIGPNGGGKTTILGAAALIYKSVPPGRFFPKGGKYDDTMQDWKITYELVDRDESKNSTVQRTARFRQFRWNRDSLIRDVLIFGVNRTVPASEKKEFRKYASNSFQVPIENEELFNDKVISAASRVIGKDISLFKRLKVDELGKVIFLAGSAKDGSSYSEFHFGAGESSVIRMIAQIESADKNSLILIEEIENGLHPVATVRLVDYLISAAKEKSSQVVFTTHSNDALGVLPDKAIWVATPDRIFQGKMDVESLRAISGKIEKKIAIFVEDDFAKTWVEAILRVENTSFLDQVEIHALHGDGNAYKMAVSHNENPAIKNPALVVIDGDSEQDHTLLDYAFRLPGQMPEGYVFDRVLEKWAVVGGRLTVALLQKFENTDKVHQVLTETRLANLDEHVLFNQIGERLGFVPEKTVQMAFSTIWSETYRAEVSDFLTYLKSKIEI